MERAVSRSSAIDLLALLRERGVELEVRGDRLRFRPASGVPQELLGRVARLKPELIALLRVDSAGPSPGASAPQSRGLASEYGDGERPSVHRCPRCGQPDFVRRHSGGAWRCARCCPYDLPRTEVEWWPRVGSAVPFDSAAGSGESKNACACCGDARWWHLRKGGPWFCARCHPPSLPPDQVEFAGAGA